LARHTTGVAKCIHVPVTKLNLDLRERMMICLESTLDATINSSDDYIIGTATQMTSCKNWAAGRGGR